MHFNKEIQLQHFITGKRTQDSECGNVFKAALGKYMGRSFVLYSSLEERQLSNPYISFRSWPVNSDSTSQILPGEGCKFDKMVQSNSRFRGLRHRPKDLSHFYFLSCKQHQEDPIPALFCCSFQRNSLSQDNQMRMTSGQQTSAKSLLFCSWQEDDVLQMPGSR